MSPFRFRFPKAEVSVVCHIASADDNAASTTSFLQPTRLSNRATSSHEFPRTPVMIRPTCAWARLGLRRTTLLTAPHTRAGTLTGFANASHVAGRTAARIGRRYNASHHPPGAPVAHKAPETTKTIPGPSWLWLEPIYEPFRAYGRIQQRRPYMTQFVSALVIYFVGDLVAQSIGSALPAVETEEEERTEGEGEEEEEEKGWVQEWYDNRDWARTGRALMIGGLAAVPGYKWFLWLGNSFNYGSKVLSLTTKVRCILLSIPLRNTC